MSDKNSLSIVLSGHVCRPESVDLRPFWNGFIQLQNQIPGDQKIKSIVSHSWNEEYEDLIDLVYKPEVQFNQSQNVFESTLLGQLYPPDFFEKKLNRARSTWKNVSIQSVLGNISSRSRAVSYLQKLDETDRVLITRWDLGQSGSKDVNQLVFDDSLPESYMYMAYFSEVDEGYADMWILAPWEKAKKFRNFELFAYESLLGKNSYLRDFCNDGWPRSIRPTKLKSILSPHIVNSIKSKIIKKISYLHSCDSFYPSFYNRLKKKITNLLWRKLTEPVNTAEVSFVRGECRSYPAFMSLNVHALLKYFVIKNDLRSETRFLSNVDFFRSNVAAKIIRPEPISLILSDPDMDLMKLENCISHTPLQVNAVFNYKEDEVLSLISNEDGFSKNAVKGNHGDYKSFVVSTLQRLVNDDGRYQPVLIMSDLKFLVGCKSWSYMNALIKYAIWSKAEFISLSENYEGNESLRFPGLMRTRDYNSFNFINSLGGAVSVLGMVDNELKSISDVEKHAARMRLEMLFVKTGELFD